tara:strand:- start:9867 stop:11738 length:1872 start_codon:yes stop_codon:yes gene_type:complete
MKPKGYTPQTLDNFKFRIPLYQRLFEWEEKQINQLLNDLLIEFKKDKSSPYYIGMLTVYQEKHGTYSLVDGQQRFTVLNLMGIAFNSSNWNNFLTVGGEPRLSFFARKNDEAYLKSKIIKESVIGHINQKMEIGIEVITKFLKDKFQDEEQSSKFVNYIYCNATFFISKLPDTYQSQDLNKYFEAMNAAGKGLENHEILKVDLLKKIGEGQEFYTKIWNSVSMMDRCMIRQKTSEREKEDVEGYRKRINRGLELLNSAQELYCLVNGSNKELKDENFSFLRDIQPKNLSPGKVLQTRDERSILNFSEFLLLVLRLQLTDDEVDKKSDFFNTNKLLENFRTYLKEDRVAEFFENLLKYRILFDNFVLRIGADEQVGNSYFINFTDEDDLEKDNRRLEQYQAMLYVSTATHLWLRPLLQYLSQNPTGQCSTSILKKLKQVDDARHNTEGLSLNYGEIDRYWFWRLDYYLWDNRENYFAEERLNQKKSLEVAGKYIFRANRSIEHVSPQTTKNGDVRRIDDKNLHWFGNLVMISSGQNSSLQNESFEVKRAHVESFINGSKNGSIESLKMLKLYEYAEWTDENLKKHQDEMTIILIDSFNEEYESVRDSLSDQLLKNQEEEFLLTD